MTNQDKINIYFNKLQAGILEHVPAIVANTAIENFQDNFFKQSFDGIPWLKVKKKPSDHTILRGYGNLFNSINDKVVSSNRVIISAGGSQIPYARIHNEGGTISRKARTDPFIRNRDAKKRFASGKTSGVGFTFSAYTYTMPKRQYMGITETLKNQIRERILKKLKE